MSRPPRAIACLVAALAASAPTPGAPAAEHAAASAAAQTAAAAPGRREALVAEMLALPFAAAGAPQKLERLSDLLWAYTLEIHPELATYEGEAVGRERWRDLSPEALGREREELAAALEVLRTIDPETLGAEDRLDRSLLLEQLELAVTGQRFPEELLAVDQLDGVHHHVPDVIAAMPARTREDYEAILARLERVPELVAQHVALLRRGIEQGVTPPRATLSGLPDHVGALLTQDPLDSPLLARFRESPAGLGELEAEALRARAVRLYREALAPAFGAFRDFLTEQYLPAARVEITRAALPDGEAWYAHLVRLSTTTSMTPQEIHDLGLAEAARIRARMDEVIADLGFDGDRRAFDDMLRTDPRFFFTEPTAMLRAYRAIAKRADPELVRLFGRLPRLPYGVEPMPARAAGSAPAAYYRRGSLAAGRPAVFLVNVHDLTARPSWRMEALTLHEAVPGHHLQIALAQERRDLRWFRRINAYTAFTEGWALYAEGLGEAMGFYRDPYSRYGQLTGELWRALRLVADTGVHAFGWTRERAIAYLLEHSARTEHEVVTEVDRYINWPGQALAYKVGELAIRRLRARAEAELGERFDLRRFHDALLAGGALPLAVLEERMAAWIDGEKGAVD